MISPEAVLRLSGHRNPPAASPYLQATARCMASLAERLSVPEAWTWRASISRIAADGAVSLEDGPQFHSRVLARLLHGAGEAVLMLLTIGPALERRVQELVAAQEVLPALLLDAAGSLCVHRAVANLRRRLSETAAAEGLRLTPRLGPGYADWPLTEQRRLFARFDQPGLPLELTCGDLILPRKSVSGLYGLAPAGGRL